MVDTMREIFLLGLTAMILQAVTYIFYVSITHGDGIAFAAAATGLGSTITALAVHCYHKHKRG